jgi:hypothetical protein
MCSLRYGLAIQYKEEAGEGHWTKGSTGRRGSISVDVGGDLVHDGDGFMHFVQC